jgi:hypothetical protein
MYQQITNSLITCIIPQKFVSTALPLVSDTPPLCFWQHVSVCILTCRDLVSNSAFKVFFIKVLSRQLHYCLLFAFPFPSVYHVFFNYSIIHFPLLVTHSCFSLYFLLLHCGLSIPCSYYHMAPLI